MIILDVIFIFNSYVCRERTLCVHGSNGYPRSVFWGGNKKKISQREGEGALAGQLRTDARTKDYKNYPKQCGRHFESDTPFHCVQSKRNPFKCCQLKRILLHSLYIALNQYT